MGCALASRNRRKGKTMAFKVSNLTVDLMSDMATVVLQDPDTQRFIHINVKVDTPGNQPENRLKEIAKAAARQTLQDALAAL